jgi:hypothetical protein
LEHANGGFAQKVATTVSGVSKFPEMEWWDIGLEFWSHGVKESCMPPLPNPLPRPSRSGKQRRGEQTRGDS